MGERVFEVEEDQRCEFCGTLGALDLYGTWVCPECAAGIFEPKKCPKCLGAKYIDYDSANNATYSEPISRTCPRCRGKGTLG
jgi:DnaJ-class molecular chaperone